MKKMLKKTPAVFVASMLAMTLLSVQNSFGQQSISTVIQLSDESQDSFWSPLTDNIRFGDKGSTAFMAVDWEKAQGSFFGELKINNGVGFASYRVRDNFNLSEFDKIRIKVKGDGREYKILMKDERAIQSTEDYSYQAAFKTKSDEEQIVELSLKDFKPVYQGKIDLSLPQVQTQNIRELGLQINDKISGPYNIQFGEWLGIKE
jgi:hypothetical protein